MQGTKEAKRDAYIDVLRGIAVLFVVFSHASNVGLHILPFLDAHGSGKNGVWLFFVLSAYLLTEHLFARLRRGGAVVADLTVFFINRAFRILPLYVCVLVYQWTVGHLSADAVLQHLTFREGWREFWALPVEVKYYLVIPLIVLLRLHSRWCGLAALGVAALVALALAPREQIVANTISLWPYLPVFLLGSAAALIDDWRPWLERRLVGLAGLCWLTMALAVPSGVVALGGTLTAPDLHVLAPLYGVAWAVILMAGRPLAVALPRWLLASIAVVGRWSFSIYLLHHPILDLMLAWDALPKAWGGGAVLLASLAVSGVTWRLIEHPGIRAGRALGRWLAPARHIRPAPTSVV